LIVQYELQEFFVSNLPVPVRSGRPKDPMKRAAIVAAAVDLFAMHSLDGVTMEAVAAAAGVSKQTVYSHFSDKETLFEATVVAMSEQMMGAALSPGSAAEEPLEMRLSKIGTAFLSMILGKKVANMGHSLPAALRGNKPLALRFYNAGPGRTRAALAAIITAAVASGELAVDSSVLAADDLVSLWEGSLPAQIVFGVVEPVSAKEIRRRARRGTKVFLRAYAASGT
jgi:TetR/AcrR family transcriptional repressor of mexJK operon